MGNRIRSTNLLLLPGMMCDQGLWRCQQADLEGQWQIHHGDITADDSIQAIARRVLAQAPSTFSVAGLSMGGIVAMEIWRQAPERVEGMALLDTNFRPDPSERQQMRNRQMAEVRQGALGSILRDELKPNYLARCHRNNTSLLDDVLYMGMALGEAVFERQSLALRDRPDSTGTLPSIYCPTLVLCGEEDSLCTPQLHREMAGLIPAAKLEIVPDCGHLSTMEQPVAVTSALRSWLTLDQ